MRKTLLHFNYGADDGSRTRDLRLGKATLYQLSYVRKQMAGVLGFEPRNDGVKVRCLTAWLYPNCNLFVLKMGRSMGLEPTNAGATIRCVNPFATTAIIQLTLAGAVGIEPTPKVLETFVLPLNYAPSLQEKQMVVRDGIEPPTRGFSVLCSTD